MLAWIHPQASLVNVPSHTTLISGLVCFCRKTTPAWQFTDLSVLSFPIRQNWFSLIVHGSLLHPVCYIDSPIPFFFCCSRFQVAAPPLCTHLHQRLSINLGRSLLRSLSIALPLSFSCHPFLFLSISNSIVLSSLPFQSLSMLLTISLMPSSPQPPVLVYFLHPFLTSFVLSCSFC